MENLELPIPARELRSTDDGYSEEEQAKIIEGSTVDIKQIKKRKPIAATTLPRHNKIVTAYENIQTKLRELVELLATSSDNPRHQEKIVEEIQVLHQIQEELVQCMLLEQRGELSETTASNRAWDLIK